MKSIFALILALPLIAASPSRAPPPIVIPIEVEQGLIIATVRIGSSRPLHFLVDTGAEATVLAAESLSEMGLEKGSAGAASVQGGETEAHAIKGAAIAIGSATLRPETVYAVPLGGLATSVGRRIDGIIGYELFERYIVQLDYSKERMVLLSADTQVRGGTAIPITIKDRTPFVAGTLVQSGRRFPGSLLIDTGGTSALTLYQPFIAANPALLPATSIAVTGGAILPGQYRARVGRLEALHLGGFRLLRPIANFSTHAGSDDAEVGDAGQIGADILRRFVVTVDYPHGRILLRPTRELKRRFDFDASGASIAAVPGDLINKRVRLVLPDSPAEASGLKAGDILSQIDGVSTKSLPLARIREMFRRPGRSYVLQVLRDGRALPVRISTRPLV